MTRTFTTQAKLIVLSTLSLAACTTPVYPTHAGPVAPEPTAPAAAPTAPATAGPAPAPSITPAPPQPAPVDSQPLPPPTAAPSPAAATPSAPPPPSPAQSALSPDYVPPKAGAEPPAVEARWASPGEPRFKAPPERLVANGRVVAAKGMFREYTVAAGDHVDAIARDLDTTRKVLIEANHLKAPYHLKPGQHLKVPVAKAYEVQAGDNLTEIAKRFGVSAGELSDLNDLPVRGHLRPGDMIALPAAYHDHGPMRLPSVTVAERTPVHTPPPRPIRTEQPPPPPIGGPYVPSPSALAAAQQLSTTRPSSPVQPPSIQPPPERSEQTVVDQGPPTAAQLAIAAAGKGRFIWPVRGDILSPFGVKGVGRRNDGIDIRSPQGTEVHAAAAGEVVYAGDQVPGFGNLVLVKHADGWVTAYAHLQTVGVQMRQTVMQGQMIGDVGSTGGVAEPELHFEIRYAPTAAEKAKPVDPLLVLPK